ncbi:aminodeoxychorismate lyase [Streptomyces avermitilis]|uniref:Endolytic murein transglycosylase n=2 Tax=Streptomyces avermitilis TaxID=33903 RepID=Q82MU7_STRAW|nr:MULTISPECIES: endolytic transglycosylase MltG [Streptomyces]KUN55025.1 aminodeoxychorismate lyase [Streptomyces avermitilis]MYS97191.1 endolytic transglycosylase MltG [Streptomyces sp. SID5469]OOV24536.1 aminodeoxychorismate lyase [Streptomyces avermitilis]BAC69274.1 putative aminodeoxychorismate lyase [Streptomyces avermitilis MA-4680 = NBRC 14893]BBJ49243.1 aminodeoxychorismate lyase [Streptomyces avermitilis]
MQMNTPPRSTIRLTRRGRGALIATGAVVAATAVAVPLLILKSDGPTRPTSLVIPEGWRSGQIYEAVDKALELPAGTTRKSLAKANLKLPGDAEGNPEGYLFPATYPLEKATPESLLRAMVDTANKKFRGSPITAGAQRNAMTMYQAVTIASIAQSEAATKADMGKVTRVVFNRLERGMPLQMDSTINYAMNRSTLNTTVADTKLDSPYNSYQRMGLPPTPIANPGEDAMRAAVNPTPGDWLYFVTVKPGDTRFTSSYEEHQKNVAEFNRNRRSPSPSPSHR